MSSSGNWQQTETSKVRACHVPRQPLHTHPAGQLGGWVTTPWSAEDMLDEQTSNSGLCTMVSREKNGRGSLLNRLSWLSTRTLFRRPSRSKDWTGLNWTTARGHLRTRSGDGGLGIRRKEKSSSELRSMVLTGCTARQSKARESIKSQCYYGCETWTLHAGSEKRIQVFETKCLRKLLSISYL